MTATLNHEWMGYFERIKCKCITVNNLALFKLKLSVNNWHFVSQVESKNYQNIRVS